MLLIKQKKSSANSGKNIMNILFENNSANEEQIAKAIADNYGLPFVTLTQNDIDLEQTKLLPETFIKTNHRSCSYISCCQFKIAYKITS